MRAARYRESPTAAAGQKKAVNYDDLDCDATITTSTQEARGEGGERWEDGGGVFFFFFLIIMF